MFTNGSQNINPKYMKEFKILSIDGGGIRGIIPAKFLTGLESYLSREKGEPIKLNEYFDLICGTSTGGIIAIGLGLGMSSSEILNLYEANATKIFGLPYTNLFRLLRQFFLPKHNRNELSKLLRKAFEPFSEDGDTRLGNSKTRLCIPAFNASTGNTVVFKTSHHKDYIRDYQVPSYQVALATSAAPIYFQPYEVNYERTKTAEKVNLLNMIDGGIFANNPALIGLSEAIALGHSFNEIKILSIGTGTNVLTLPNQRKAVGSGLLGFAIKLIEFMMQSQSSITENMMKIFAQGVHHDKADRFYYQRFQDKFNISDNLKLDSTSTNKIKMLNQKGMHLFDNADKTLLQPFFENKIVPYKPFFEL